MDIYVYEINSQSASSGTWALNTPDIKSGICKQIILSANASSLTFDFKLIDDKSNVAYDTIRREKTATFVLDDEVELPLRGIYTLRVYNASQPRSTALHVMVSLATNDYLELYVGNTSDADDCTIHSLNLFAMGM